MQIVNAGVDQTIVRALLFPRSWLSILLGRVERQFLRSQKKKKEEEEEAVIRAPLSTSGEKLSSLVLLRQRFASWFEDTSSLHQRRIRSILWFFSVAMALWLVVVLVMLNYIFFTGGSLGSRSMSFFGVVFSLLLVEDLLLLEPAMIAMKYGMLHYPTLVYEMNYLFNYFARRAKIILMRRQGLIRHANDFIQHFNIACRVARSYPSLPIARFLFSLNDADIPLKLHVLHYYDQHPLKLVFFHYLPKSLAFLYYSTPSPLNGLVLAGVNIAGINLLVYFCYFLVSGEYFAWYYGLLVLLLLLLLPIFVWLYRKVLRFQSLVQEKKELDEQLLFDIASASAAYQDYANHSLPYLKKRRMKNKKSKSNNIEHLLVKSTEKRLETFEERRLAMSDQHKFSRYRIQPSELIALANDPSLLREKGLDLLSSLMESKELEAGGEGDLKRQTSLSLSSPGKQQNEGTVSSFSAESPSFPSFSAPSPQEEILQEWRAYRSHRRRQRERVQHYLITGNTEFPTNRPTAPPSINRTTREEEEEREEGEGSKKKMKKQQPPQSSNRNPNTNTNTSSNNNNNNNNNRKEDQFVFQKHSGRLRRLEGRSSRHYSDTAHEGPGIEAVRYQEQQVTSPKPSLALRTLQMDSSETIMDILREIPNPFHQQLDRLASRPPPGCEGGPGAVLYGSQTEQQQGRGLLSTSPQQQYQQPQKLDSTGSHNEEEEEEEDRYQYSIEHFEAWCLLNPRPLSAGSERLEASRKWTIPSQKLLRQEEDDFTMEKDE